jgi:lysophospholipase L1-like esterase
MLRLLDDVALLEHVAVFHRFDIMRGWVAAGEVELPALISADGLHMRDLGYRCLGDLLASAILEAMQDPTAEAQLSR